MPVGDTDPGASVVIGGLLRRAPSHSSSPILTEKSRQVHLVDVVFARREKPDAVARHSVAGILAAEH